MWLWHGAFVVKAVILCAGSSTRLRPLTDEIPKCLLPVGEVPILRRAMSHLQALRIDEVVVVTGYREERIHQAVRAWGTSFATTFVSNPEYASTNNAYSLLLSRPHVEGEELLLLDGDIVFERTILDLLLENAHPDCLALRPAPDLGDEEIKCELDADGMVVRIGKDVPVARAAGESIGIERFSPATSRRLFEVLEDRVRRRGLVNEWYEASFQEMIDAGARIEAVDVQGRTCIEIDTADDLSAADRAVG